MSHIVRLHMSQVYVCTAQGCGAVREGKRLFVCPVAHVLWLGRCGGSHAEGQQPPTKYLRSGAPGRTVGEEEDLRKDACVHRV